MGIVSMQHCFCESVYIIGMALCVCRVVFIRSEHSRYKSVCAKKQREKTDVFRDAGLDELIRRGVAACRPLSVFSPE